ncbi:MAG: hypothetical protein KME08_10710 [Aphanothece sp. CMT-3BRIN-NPC111]|nr:hypothetical protein [Aphanothece sp. CMT-3BRIN-NPC111]
MVRWHDRIPGIPENIHYGLATQYPEEIACYAAFIAGFNRTEALSRLRKQTHRAFN